MSETHYDEAINPVAFVETMRPEITGCVTSVSKEDFADNFKSYDWSDETIETLHTTMSDKIRKDAEKKINAIFNDQEIEEVYEKCIEIRKHGEKVDGKAWRPSRNVKDDMRSLYIDSYDRGNEHLKLNVAGMEKENKILLEQFEKKNMKCKVMEKNMSEFLRESEKSIIELIEVDKLGEQFFGDFYLQGDPDTSHSKP